jgi:import inner membrane translocase subunit TIM16
MAIGPLGRILAQVVVPVIAVLARALPAAYAAAVQNAKKNGGQAAKQGMDAAPWQAARMSRSEALQIMNLAEQEATAEAIQKVCIYEEHFQFDRCNVAIDFLRHSFVVDSFILFAHLFSQI